MVMPQMPLHCLTTHQNPQRAAAIHPAADLRGISAALFEAEVLFCLQDGRNPSSEWQRRASAAARGDNRYPPVLPVGTLALVCPLSVLTSLVMLNESRKVSSSAEEFDDEQAAALKPSVSTCGGLGFLSCP